MDIKDFTENYGNIAIDTDLEERQNQKMLEQMQDSIEELETEKSFGFDDLSLEMYRQDLALELENRLNHYLQLPNGIFSGVAFAEAIENEQKEGIIALLGSPVRKAKQKKAYQQLKLIYVDAQGKEIIVNEKISDEYFTATEMMFISEVSDKKNAVQIAKDLCVTKALVSITAKKLENKGYLERDKSVSDRRAHIFYFTPKGEEIKGVVERVKIEFKKSADKLVTSEGIKVINKIVEILLKKLGE